MADNFILAYEQSGFYNPYRNYTFTELKSQLGSTKAASEALGVSARQGARYLAYESGSKSQARSTRKVQGTINLLMSKLLKKPNSSNRLTIKGRFWISNGYRDRTVPASNDTVIDGEDIQEILRDIMENGYTFEEAFAPHYGWVEFDDITNADYNIA